MSVIVYTVFKNPKDFPGKYVVRKFSIVGEGKITADKDAIYVGESLKEARASIPEGLARIESHPTDEPHIVETWI